MEIGDALAGLCRDRDALERIDAQHLLDFLSDLVGASAGQVDLVEHGHDLEVLLHREVGVDHGLGLDTLRRIDDQQRPLTRLERPRDLVAEVHMPGGVDEVEHVLLAVVHMHHRDGRRLDGDAALAFEVHRIELLGLGLAIGDGVGGLEEPVGERGLAVVDMRDNGEVSDMHGFKALRCSLIRE